MNPLQITLDGGRSYEVVYGPLNDLPTAMVRAGLRPGRVLMVTDRNVADCYLDLLVGALGGTGWEPETVILPPGETTKSPGYLQEIYDFALNLGIDRKTPVIALGGGVVGDLAGFAAATLLRGLPVVQVPTTLVAAIDSSLGGKTGINHPVGKNLIGAFHQPRLVYSDVEVMHSLPYREWTGGLAEVVKHGLIYDADLFDRLESEWDAILNRDAGIIGPIIRHAAGIKARVVSADELEGGLRAILNFGHTFGHAIEKVAGYGQFTHGEAVALGMRAALFLSAELNPAFPSERADALVRRIPVPGGFDDLDHDALTDAMRTDKKVQAGTLRFVVLDEIGKAHVQPVGPELIRQAWRHV